jgi:HEAT repeat protein
MSGKRKFEEQVAALDVLRQQSESARIEPLRKALAHQNNFIVAKAADLVRELALAELLPDLLTAFDRFLENPEKSDPQCWAKNAIGRALAAMEHQDADVFLRGMRHVQLEPVWGGSSDSAATLRATCALALVQCRSLREPELLAHLVELVADKDKTVRAEVVRAIELVNSTAAALLLRMRATIGNDEPEVLGTCYGGVLRIEGIKAIPWVAKFLSSQDDSAGEAALAIAATHSPEGFRALRDCPEQAHGLSAADPWFRSVLLSAIALTRQEEAIEFLLEMVRKNSPDAERAIEAMMRAGPSDEVAKKLKKLVTGNPRLERTLAAESKASQR